MTRLCTWCLLVQRLDAFRVRRDVAYTDAVDGSAEEGGSRTLRSNSGGEFGSFGG